MSVYNRRAMKSKENEDHTDQGDAEENSSADGAEDGAADEDRNDDQPERFERPDNLRRRSEWFQKRTGGGRR